MIQSISRNRKMSAVLPLVLLAVAAMGLGTGQVGSANTKNMEGYWLVKKSDHPQADKNGYILEHRLVYENSRNCCIIPQLLGHPIHVHHRDENKTNNIWYNLMLILRSGHMKIHNPKEDFGAICRCGSKDIKRDGVHHKRQEFRCNDCRKTWGIPVSKLQIMLKEYKGDYEIL